MGRSVHNIIGYGLGRSVHNIIGYGLDKEEIVHSIKKRQLMVDNKR